MEFKKKPVFFAAVSRCQFKKNIKDACDSCENKEADAGFEKIFLLPFITVFVIDEKYHNNGKKQDKGNEYLGDESFKYNVDKEDNHTQVDGPERQIF